VILVGNRESLFEFSDVPGVAARRQDGCADEDGKQEGDPWGGRHRCSRLK
jgi:hypothetical protein